MPEETFQVMRHNKKLYSCVLFVHDVNEMDHEEYCTTWNMNTSIDSDEKSKISF